VAGGYLGARVLRDEQGVVLVPTRNGEAARAQGFDPNTATWTPLGEPVTAVEGMDITAYGGTYLVRTAGQGMTFCPPQSFEPTDTELTGATLQVVRPADGVSMVRPLDEGWPAVAPDGRCVAMIGSPNTTVVDLATGDERILSGVQGVTWWSPAG
jgi:hypothetical protein